MFWPPLGPLRPPWGGRWRQGRRRFENRLGRPRCLGGESSNYHAVTPDSAPHPTLGGRPAAPDPGPPTAAHRSPTAPPAGRGPNAPPGAAGPPRGRPPAPPPPAFCPPAAEKRLGSEKRLPTRPRADEAAPPAILGGGVPPAATLGAGARGGLWGHRYPARRGAALGGISSASRRCNRGARANPPRRAIAPSGAASKQKREPPMPTVELVSSCSASMCAWARGVFELSSWCEDECER